MADSVKQDTTESIATLRQHPDADEGARAWAMGVAHDTGGGLTGDAKKRWQWGWRDAEAGYREQFKERGW